MPPKLPSWSMAVASCLAATCMTTPVLAADYVQAPGSTLHFTSQYDGEAFVGAFPGFQTKLSFDPAKLASAKLDVRIPLTSVNSGNGDRDSTLKGTDFFNVAKFADAHYRADKFRALGGNRYAADGTLELRGVSKPVELIFTWTASTQPTLTGKAIVKRLDFGIGGSDWADTKLIPNETTIETKVIFNVK